MQKLISEEVKEKIRNQSILESLFMKELTEEVIGPMYAKRYNTVLLQSLCNVDYRIQLYNEIQDPNFKFSVPRVGFVPKDDGTLREVLILPEKERFLMNLLNKIYSIKYEYMISERSRAYRIGGSTSDVVLKLKNLNTNGVKGDISKYFDNVSQETINSILNKCNTGANIEKALFTFYNTNLIQTKDGVEERFKSLCQGCGMSGFLANVALRDFDDKMSELSEVYYRYSDDFILQGDNWENALEVGKEILKSKGLQLNPNKIKPVNPDTEYKFLGFGIYQHDILMAKDKFDTKKKEIKHIAKVTRSEQVKKYGKVTKHYPKLVIRQINKLLFGMGSVPEYGWIYHTFSTITNTERVYQLDEYIKDTIRHYYTGKSSKKHGYNKLSDQELYDNGYVSLMHWYNVINNSKELFYSEYRKHIKNNKCELRII